MGLGSVKKVRVWEYLVAPCRPPDEQGMFLYSAVGGEAAEELETLPLSNIASPDGVNAILDFLRPAFAQPRVQRIAERLRKNREFRRRDRVFVHDALNRRQRRPRASS